MADMVRRLSAAQCEAAIRDGEFGAEVASASQATVVILTQSWCPQWHAMRLWLDGALAKAGASAWYVEYDREPFFERFMEWKEDVLGNRTIPYLRYYSGGRLAAESNYVSADGFAARLARKPE